MCGFFGIFSPEGLKLDRGKLESLTNLIHHRGPDENGYFVNNNISLGFKRLSIIDIKHGQQPMHFSYNEKNYSIIYNGEVYNYKKLSKISQNTIMDADNDQNNSSSNAGAPTDNQAKSDQNAYLCNGAV